MFPPVELVSGTGQRPESSSSITAHPSFSSFQFSTIGKEPELLRRISAPEPNQDYQDDSTPCPSPSHSPALEHQDISSRPSLLQKLTIFETNTASHSTIGNAPSDLNPGTSTTKASSAFDPEFAALFSSSNMQMIQIPSIPATRRRPRSPSDMDTSSSGTTPRTERITRSLSLTQPAPAGVGLNTEHTRFTSADHLNRSELAYPATEGRLSVSQEPFDSHRHPSRDVDATADQEISTRLNNVISQSKVLATIASLERDFQLVASQTSLALDKANRAEAAAEKSLSIATDALALAQQSVAAANVANAGVVNALTALVHLRQCYIDEHAAHEHDPADLCKVKRNIESFSSHGSSCNTNMEPQGLGSEVLSAEAMKLVHERDPGAQKRKHSSDKIDPSNTCDLTSRPSKEARREHPVLFFVRTVESEAEVAREAWVQEAERRSAVPPDPGQWAAHEQKEKEAMTCGRKGLVMGEDSHGQAARSGPSQSQLVNEDVDMSSDKPDAPFVEGSEQNGALGNSRSEESLEKLRAQREREVVEYKLEITRFQMQERDLQEKEDKRKEVEGIATTASEQKVQSAPPRPSPTFVPATATVANILERNAQQTSQPKPGPSDTSRLQEVKNRLAREKQRALPAIGQGSSIAPCAAQTLSQQNVIRGKQLQETPRSVVDTGRSDFQGQAQTGNDGVTGREQEQGEKGREIDDKVTGAKPRGRGTPTARGSMEAKDTSKLSVRNVTTQKTLAPVHPKTATSQQRGKTSVPQTSASTATANPLLQPMSRQCGSFLLNDPLCQPVQSRNQDTRRASLPPIACISEPDQAESNSAIKHPPSSRSPQERKQGVKKPAKPQQDAGSMDAHLSSTEPGPRKKDAASNGPAVPPLTPASIDVFPKAEVISPTLSSFDRRTSSQEAQNSSSSVSVQPVIASPQYIDNPAPMCVLEPSRDSHQVSPVTEPRSEPPSRTAERGLRAEPTNSLQPLLDNGQVVAAVDRVSKPPSKITLASLGQTGNASTFLKTPHGGHREISGSAASSKPPSRSVLVDQSVSGKAPLPTNGQQISHAPCGEVSATLNSTHATVVDSSLDAPAASANMPTARSSMPENLPANVSTSPYFSQTPSSNGHSSGVLIQDSNPVRQATNQVETSQQPIHSKPAYSESRPFRSRSRSRHSSPPAITNRKRNWSATQGDHWYPGLDTWGRRPRAAPRMPVRSRSPIQRVPLSQRLSESTNPHGGRSTSYIHRPKGDSYRPDESPSYDDCGDDIDRPHNQSKSLLNRFTENTRDPSYRQGHNEFVPAKRAKFGAPRNTSREERGGALTLQERIS